MWKTVLRRVLLMIPQIIILSVLVFTIAHFMPGDPFTGKITPDMGAEVIEQLRERHGLNDPLPQQYFRWVGNAVKGDFGVSYIYKQPVTALIGQKASNTILLSLVSLILTYMIALPLGMFAGRYNDSWFDKGVVIYNYVSFAVPTFVLARLIVWIFGYKLGWFPASGTVDVT